MRYRPVSQARCWFGLQLALVLLGLPVSIARGVPPIELEFVLAATSPLYLTHAGDDRVFVVQRNGVIWQYRAGDAQPEVFLDIVDLVDDSGSGGLYTAAFHPDFAGNGRFFVSYTESGSAAVPLRTVIARYESAPGSPNPVDPATGRVVLRFDQPAPSHNNGQIAFNPKDGNLYIGSGDGGDHDGCEAQFGHHLLGKILRIDVDAGADQPPYHSIPADNPFLAAGDGVADETWALGFRNPWRFSFDRVSGDLFIADVGEFLKEEINRQPADSPGGENYGWRVMEGSVCNSADPEAAGCPVGTPSCFDAAYSVPIFDYDTGENCAIVGGYVYRGDAIPGLRGKYVFGDVCSTRIWALTERTDGSFESTQIGDANAVATGRFPLTSLGEDADGELYVMVDDQVHRLRYGGAPVEIDIQPHTPSNRIRTVKGAWTRVALFGSETIDVTTIDTDLLMFGPAKVAPDRVYRTRGGWKLPLDINHDRHADLLLDFRSRKTGLTYESEEACLEGVVNGLEFAACDRVRVVTRPRRPRLSK